VDQVLVMQEVVLLVRERFMAVVLVQTLVAGVPMVFLGLYALFGVLIGHSPQRTLEMFNGTFYTN
jgi:hypothetical protein